MKAKQWILIGAACLVCIGAGISIGLLLGHSNSGTAEPALLGQGSPLPAGTEAPVLLGGIKGIGGDGGITVPDSSPIQSQLDSLAHELDGLAADFNALTAGFKQEAAARDEWLALRQSAMMVVISGKKDKTVTLPGGFAAACEKLGVKATVASGGKMNIGDWNKALADISAGIGAAQTRLKQTLENLKSKLAQYEQKREELQSVQQQAAPVEQIKYTDMAPLMKTVVDWAEELIPA